MYGDQKVKLGSQIHNIIHIIKFSGSKELIIRILEMSDAH